MNKERIGALITKPETSLTKEERQDKLEYLLKTKAVKAKVFNVLGDVEKSKKLIATIGQISDMYSVEDCTLESVIDSAIMIAGLGLSPIPELGESYIIGYKGKRGEKTAKPDISYKGWKKIGREQGLEIEAEGVFEGIEVGDYEDVFKLPYRLQLKTGDVKWVEKNLLGVVVKIVDIKTGYIKYNFVDKSMLDKLKSVSPSVKAKKQSPYDDWYYDMLVRAKAIKYIAKKEIQFSEAQANAMSLLFKTDATAAEDIKEVEKPKIDTKGIKEIAKKVDTTNSKDEIIDAEEIKDNIDPVTGEVVEEPQQANSEEDHNPFN